MSLNRLEITNFRNISHLSLEPSPRFNLIYGKNGSGKTSILEAIHMLGLGRSFRSRLAHRIVKHGEPQLTVFGVVQKSPEHVIAVGVEKQRNSQGRIRIDQKDVLSAASLAEILPVQVINPDSYRLLDAGPKYRRQ